MSQLKVGAGKANINPTPDMFPIPSKFADWGMAPQCQMEIYDDIFCRAIVIDNGKERTMLMSWETHGFPGHPTLRKKLSDEFGIPEENFLICGTHNHSAPKDVHSSTQNENDEEVIFHKKYWKIEEKAAFEACRMAIDSMRPAKYGFGEVDSYMNVNRDVKTPYGYWVEGKNFAGYSDRTLATIKFVDADNKLICAFVNYPMHNTCLHMMKDFDGKAKTSGNVSGIACRYAEEHYGNDVVIAWSSGAAGNQNPLLSHNLQYEYADGYSTSVPFPDGIGFMLMEYCGRNHGADIVRGIDDILDYSENMPMVHVSKNVQLPAQKRADGLPKGRPIRMGGYRLRSDDMPYGMVPPIPDVPEMVDDSDNSIELGMQLHIIGDIALVCVNAEPYCEIGRDMKAASPYKKTMIVTHTGDKLKSAGYIMDRESVARGSKVFQAFGYVKAGACEKPMIENELKLFDMALKKF